MKRGEWQRLDCQPAWEGNGSWDAFIIHAWEGPRQERMLIVVNYAAHQSQCYAKLPFPEIKDHTVHLEDTMSSASYIREGNDLLAGGLYLDLGPWCYHIFTLESEL